MPALVRHTVEYSLDDYILSRTPGEVRSALSQLTGQPVHNSSIISVNGTPMMNNAERIEHQHARLSDVTFVEVYQQDSMPFNLEVHKGGNPRMSVSVTWQNTIGEIKAIIGNKYGIPPGAQCLRFDGKRDLKDDQKLRDVMVPITNAINLVDLSNDRFTIMVKTLTGKYISINAGVLDTVWVLKEKIQNKEGIPPDQLRIVFSGTTLEDSQVLGSYGITMGSILHMTLTLRGCDCGCGLDKYYMEGE